MTAINQKTVVGDRSTGAHLLLAKIKGSQHTHKHTHTHIAAPPRGGRPTPANTDVCTWYGEKKKEREREREGKEEKEESGRVWKCISSTA